MRTRNKATNPFKKDNGDAMNESKKIASVVMIAEILGCSTGAIYKKCQRNQLPYYKRNGVILFDLNEVTKYLLDDDFHFPAI
jgi:hypothetical protein